MNSCLTRFLLIILLAGVSVCAQSAWFFGKSSSKSAAKGFVTPEEAAFTMFRACAKRSHRLFVQSRLLGVCEGENDWPNRYAASLHLTTFRNGTNAFTMYDLPKRMKEEAARVVAGDAFSAADVAKLQPQFLSTYYGQDLHCFEVKALNYDGLEYTTRIVVSKKENRWYAIPRCRSSKDFYKVADGMKLTSR